MSVDNERGMVAQVVAQNPEGCATTFDEILGRMKLAVGAKSDTAFAKAMGFSQSSISGAKERQSIPPAWAIQLAERFDISVDWIWFGKGRMKPEGGAMFRPAKLPSQDMVALQDEGDGQQAEAQDVAAHIHVNTDSVFIDAESAERNLSVLEDIVEGCSMEEQDEESDASNEPVLIRNDKGEAFDAGEAIAQTVRVLVSKSAYSSALLANIRAFDRAVTTEKKLKEFNKFDIKAANQALIQKLGEFDKLKAENKRLKAEIARLVRSAT